MRKTILTTLGSILLVASMTQMAAAVEYQGKHKAARAPTPAVQQFRNANAFALPSATAAQEDWPRYSNGAASAPAGR
jgi:hypothetical protein